MGQKFTTPPTKEQKNDLLTPEAPSIAFPLANPPVAPEPVVRRKYLRCTKTFANPFACTFSFQEEEKQPPRFQLSSLSPQERIDYSHLIEELGEFSTLGQKNAFAAVGNNIHGLESGQQIPDDWK